MDLERIRRLIISAVCSDDDLLDLLVLKGGNALGLIHGIGNRSSVDVDFSMSGDFEDLEGAKFKLFTALKSRFNAHGHMVFDETFLQKPSMNPIDPEWGGYQIEFKLISCEKYQELEGNLEAIRRQSLDVDEAGGARKFKIDISKYEYTEGKEEAVIDEYICYVYTLPMIAAEKLRAICQQMEGYDLVKKPRARARDFYDIFAIVNARAMDFAKVEFKELVRNMFEAKRVDLAFLGNIAEQYDFHAQDWSAVKNSIQDVSQDFRFYFDFVVEQVLKLESLWIK